MKTSLNRMGRIRLFPLLFQNGCSQSSRFLPQARRIVGSGYENACEQAHVGARACARSPEREIEAARPFSSPEPTILLACGRNRELWEQPALILTVTIPLTAYLLFLHITHHFFTFLIILRKHVNILSSSNRNMEDFKHPPIVAFKRTSRPSRHFTESQTTHYPARLLITLLRVRAQRKQGGKRPGTYKRPDVRDFPQAKYDSEINARSVLIKQAQ